MKRIAVLPLIVLLSLTGCLATAPPEPTPTAIDYAQLAQDALAHLAAVQEVTVAQEPTGAKGSPVVALEVTMTDAATADEVAQLADATVAFSEQYAAPGQWTATIGFELVDNQPDDDLPAQDRNGFAVYPEGIDARDFMAVKDASGVTSAMFGSDFPFVTVASASDLPATQQLLDGLSLWEQGGKLWAENGRVRLTELPESLTDDGYAAIMEASAAFPAAQFWLEAPTTGHGWPQLFVDQVSTEEAAGIQAALAGPFAAASDDVNYFIRAITADGPVDSAGVLGKN